MWIGAAARRAELAGIPGENYAFRAGDIADFGSVVIARQSAPGLSSECVLAMLLRRVMLDAKHTGYRTEQVVVTLDHLHDESPSVVGRLERFLSEVLSVEARVLSFESAIKAFLARRVEDGGACGLLALDDHAWVAKVAAGKFRASRIVGHRGLLPLREAVEETASESAEIPGWSRHRVWKEFIGWHSGPSRTTDAPAFLPHLVDRRFRRQAIVPAVAHDASRAIFATAVAGALGAMDDLPPGTELWLVGDDALELGLRDAIEPRRQTSLRIKTQGSARIAIAMAEAYPAGPASIEAAQNYGVLVRNAGDAAKQLHALVAAGSPLPAKGNLALSGLSGKQRRFKVDLAAQSSEEPPRLLRHMYFECKSEAFVNEIRLTLRIYADHRISLEAVNAETEEPLQFVESAIPGGNGGMIAGPDAIAQIPLVGGTS